MTTEERLHIWKETRAFDDKLAMILGDDCDNCGLVGRCGCREVGIGSGVPMYTVNLDDIISSVDRKFSAWRLYKTKQGYTGMIWHDDKWYKACASKPSMALCLALQEIGVSYGSS